MDGIVAKIGRSGLRLGVAALQIALLSRSALSDPASRPCVISDVCESSRRWSRKFTIIFASL